MDRVGDGVEEAVVCVVNENQFHKRNEEDAWRGEFECVLLKANREARLWADRLRATDGWGLIGSRPLRLGHENRSFGAGVAFDGLGSVIGVEEGFERIEGHPVGAPLFSGRGF